MNSGHYFRKSEMHKTLQLRYWSIDFSCSGRFQGRSHQYLFILLQVNNFNCMTILITILIYIFFGTTLKVSTASLIWRTMSNCSDTICVNSDTVSLHLQYLINRQACFLHVAESGTETGCFVVARLCYMRTPQKSQRISTILHVLYGPWLLQLHRVTTFMLVLADECSFM